MNAISMVQTTYNGKYVSLTFAKDFLYLTMDAEQKKEIEEDFEYPIDAFVYDDFVHDIICNSKIWYGDASELNQLSEAPCFCYVNPFDEDNNLTNLDNNSVYAFLNYQIKDFARHLLENDEVVFARI